MTKIIKDKSLVIKYNKINLKKNMIIVLTITIFVFKVSITIII